MAIMAFVSQNEKIFTRAPRFRVEYQAPHAVARDGTDAVTGDGTNAVTGDGTHAVTAAAPHAVAADGSHAVAGDGTHAVAGDGSDAVAADRRSHACAAATTRRARRRGPGPPRTAPRVPHAGGEKKYKGRPPSDSLNRTYLGLVQRPHESF